MPTNLDDIDIKILHHLQREARISNVELAERVGLSPAPCLRRVRALEEAGIASLAIDLRGHGESTHTADGRTLDYHQFTDADHQGSREDVRAALKFLVSKGARDEQMLLVGASIGANLAFDALAGSRALRGAVLLSPGLDYRGVKTDTLVQKIAPASALYLAASREDEYSFMTVRELARMIGERQPPLDLVVKELIEAKHGTAMFEREPAFMEEVAQWVAVRLQ
jgi:pimeloyl-ACP methyl ester carboxylesterase